MVLATAKPHMHSRQAGLSTVPEHRTNQLCALQHPQTNPCQWDACCFPRLLRELGLRKQGQSSWPSGQGEMQESQHLSLGLGSDQQSQPQTCQSHHRIPPPVPACPRDVTAEWPQFLLAQHININIDTDPHLHRPRRGPENTFQPGKAHLFLFVSL